MRYAICLAVLGILGLYGIGATVTASEPAYSYGRAQPSCAPWDGPAIDIRLTTEPAQCQQINGPYIALGIWRGLPIHSGQVVKFGATSDAGFASFCHRAGDCERADSGIIVFDTYKDGSGASGHYDLHFKNGKDVNGTFTVEWCENHIVCR